MSFLHSRCDEEGFHGTWKDFLTVPENEFGGFVELKDKKKKTYIAGRYGIAIEEACKAEGRGQQGAAGEVIDLLMEKVKDHPAGMEKIVKAAEKTENKTHKTINKGKAHKLPVWEDSDSSSSSD
mmetsp:Transcript_46497/g.86945  ORF Transcript_46497/g.86945 Transcript_46497/m.86945 type:complete len:124 (+) Transcript_46497:88-459(+)